MVAACGSPDFVRAEWLKEGAVVVDVGITYEEKPDGNGCEIYGDVQFTEETLMKVSRITPVPGGVGPMTITMLMNNLTIGWMRQNFNLIMNDSVYRSI